MFDLVVRGRLFELDKQPPVSAEKARRELGWEARSNDDTIIDTARSLLAEVSSGAPLPDHRSRRAGAGS